MIDLDIGKVTDTFDDIFDDVTESIKIFIYDGTV